MRLKNRRFGRNGPRALSQACVLEPMESRRLMTAIDPAFGTSGLVTTDISGSGSTDAGYDVAVQSDGKVVTVGSSGGDFAITRYNPDGSLDTDFNSTGILTVNMGGTDAAHSVAIQSDGKIVVAGESSGDWALLRLNTDGTLDTSFDSDGKVITNLSSSTDSAWSTVIDPSTGDIYAAGVGNTIDSHNYVAICRYNSDGSLDTTWDGDGKKFTAFSSDNTAYAIQLDGKVVIAGKMNGDFLIARYNTSGSFDTGFSADGRQTIDFGTSSDGAYGLAVQSDGKILVSGNEGTGTASVFAVARLTTSGSLDTSFNSTGKVTTDFGGSASAVAYDVVVLPTGQIVAGGTANGNLAVARYTSSGVLDTTFDSDGMDTVDAGSSTDGICGIALDGNGNLMVAGTTGSDFVTAHFYVSPLTAATGLTAIGSSDVVELDWTDSNFGEANWMIERATVSDFSDAETILIGATDVGTYNDTDVVDGEIYYYRITAISPGNSSSVSSAIGVLTTPVGAGELTLSPDPDNSSALLVSWDNASATGRGAIELTRATDPDFTAGVTPLTVADGATTYSDSAISLDTPYYYRARRVASGTNGLTSTTLTADSDYSYANGQLSSGSESSPPPAVAQISIVGQQMMTDDNGKVLGGSGDFGPMDTSATDGSKYLNVNAGNSVHFSAAGVDWATAGNSTVTFIGSPTGGTYKITATVVNGGSSTTATTASISFSSSVSTTKANIKAALEALSIIGTGHVTVTTYGGAYVISISGVTGTVKLSRGLDGLTGGSSPDLMVKAVGQDYRGWFLDNSNNGNFKDNVSADVNWSIISGSTTIDSFRGFNAAYVFPTTGTYKIVLTILPSGASSPVVATQWVNVVANARDGVDGSGNSYAIYVSDDGTAYTTGAKSDGQLGRVNTKPITTATVSTFLADYGWTGNFDIYFHRGKTFNFGVPDPTDPKKMRILFKSLPLSQGGVGFSNVFIGAYKKSSESTSLPLPVLNLGVYGTGEASYPFSFVGDKSSTNTVDESNRFINIANLTIKGAFAFSQDTHGHWQFAGKGSAMSPSGRSISFQDSTIDHVFDAVNANAMDKQTGVHGLLIRNVNTPHSNVSYTPPDKSSPITISEPGPIGQYFLYAALGNSDIAVVDASCGDSVANHTTRTFASRILISGCTFRNTVDLTAGYKYTDVNANTLRVHDGSYIWWTHNDVTGGQVLIGTYNKNSDSSNPDYYRGAQKYLVVEDNVFRADRLELANPTDPPFNEGPRVVVNRDLTTVNVIMLRNNYIETTKSGGLELRSDTNSRFLVLHNTIRRVISTGSTVLNWVNTQPGLFGASTLEGNLAANIVGAQGFSVTGGTPTQIDEVFKERGVAGINRSYNLGDGDYSTTGDTNVDVSVDSVSYAPSGYGSLDSVVAFAPVLDAINRPYIYGDSLNPGRGSGTHTYGAYEL